MITVRILKPSLVAASAGLRISIQTVRNLAMEFTHSLERSSFRLPQEPHAECSSNVRTGCSDHSSSSPYSDSLLTLILSLFSRFTHLPTMDSYLSAAKQRF